MFGVKSFDKSRQGSRVVSAANSAVLEKPGKHANASTRSKRLSIKQQNPLHSVNLLPTIQDDVESKSVHKEIRSKAEEDFDNLVTNTLAEQKDDLFSGKNLTPSFVWEAFKRQPDFACSRLVVHEQKPANQRYPRH